MGKAKRIRRARRLQEAKTQEARTQEAETREAGNMGAEMPRGSSKGRAEQEEIFLPGYDIPFVRALWDGGPSEALSPEVRVPAVPLFDSDGLPMKITIHQPVGSRKAANREIGKRILICFMRDEAPELDGLSPRQAVATEEGRRKVRGLIERMEADDAKPWALFKRGPVFDFNWLRSELGLAEVH